jgi:Tfp pilus assembly protein PilN
MIEINLTPGASRKSKGRGAGFALAGVMGDAKSSIKDPYLIAAVVSLLAAAGGVGSMHFAQTSKAATLAAREEQAVADSARFATVLRQRRHAEAKRDSVLKQLEVIRAIDADRFIWPHVMDEVSRALPPYTWLKTLAVLAPQVAPAGAAPAPPPAAPGDSAKPVAAPVVAELAKFRLVGNTVDIQALTRFMKLLEASPFIQKVTLARSEMALVEGKEVTEFTLEAQYERHDSSMILTQPVSLSVR